MPFQTGRGELALHLRAPLVTPICTALTAPFNSKREYRRDLNRMQGKTQPSTSIRKCIPTTIECGDSYLYCDDAMLQGSQILSACGAYVVEEKEQEARMEYLTGLQQRIEWRTDKMLRYFREQWDACGENAGELLACFSMC
jgi:hypothetical protein